MPWPVHPTGFFGARGDNDTYRIERSLRFNSADSAYLNRTPASAGNRKTWTWSGWIKRGTLGATQRIFTASNATTIDDSIAFLSSDVLTFYFYNNSYQSQIVTTALFRDVSSWYHIIVSVDTTQATAANRIKFYVNGSEITSFSTSTYPTQNFDGDGFNTTLAHNIGRYQGNSAYFNGYLTEINFIDGQALTPSSFGETDAITGRWKAKAYSGTYGTNGFYLKFADNSGTTATTLGKDSSGNGNNWTPNNFSVTAGAGNDSLVDSPTNYGTDTGVGGEVRGNYCTISPFQLAVSGALFSLANGNLDYSCSASTGNGGRMVARGTHALPATKTYWEIFVTSTNPSIGICDTGRVTDSYGAGSNLKTISVYSSGAVVDGSSATYSGSSWSFTTNDIIGFAFDGTAMTLGCYKNGTLIGTFSGIESSITWLPLISVNTSAASTSMVTNFGQRPFAYTAPAGYKALCTTNLPQPTIQKPSKYMDVVTYTGNGSTQTISSLGFSPDFLWSKSRSVGRAHRLIDSVRGIDNVLVSDTTAAEYTGSAISSFNSNGFSLKNADNYNINSETYVAWSWDEAPIAGMDIVSYTGNGTNRTIAHNLGVAPKMMIVKSRSSGGSLAYSWVVWHSSLTGSEYLILNLTQAKASAATIWNSTVPTSSVFNLGTDSGVNENNVTYIAYLFAEIEGFSKFGSYTGNGSADGPFVWCGFRPRWVMWKNSGAVGNWVILDTSRDSFNLSGRTLSPNLSNAEFSGSVMDINSNGFKLRDSSSDNNASSNTYIFAAFAESPFKYARAR